MKRVFSPPVETGAYFIWLSSVVFSLWNLPDNRILVVPGIIGGILLLFSLDYLKTKVDIYSISITILLFLLFLPYVLRVPPLHAWLTILYVGALISLSKANVRLTRILGGGIIGMAGGLLSLPRLGLFQATVFPSIYAILGTVQASARVSGRTRIENVIESIVIVVMLAYAYWFFVSGYYLTTIVIVVDLAHRLVLELTGYSYRMQIKKYGVLESIRGLLTNGIAGYYFHNFMLAGLLLSG